MRADQEPSNRLPGFQPAPHRRMSKDYEFQPSSSETWIYLGIIRVMLKRLTHARIQPAFHYRRVA